MSPEALPVSAGIIPMAAVPAVGIQPDIERRSDIVYYGGDNTFTVQYGGHNYDLLPQTPVRIPPRMDFPADELTGRKLRNMPLMVAKGGDGASIAAQLAEHYGNQGVTVLFDDDGDAARMKEAQARSLGFRVAQATNIKEHWLRQLDRIRPGSLPPPQPPHVEAALSFLHKLAKGALGRKRFVTWDGRDFETYELAADHLETLWPEKIQANGGLEGLIVDIEAGKDENPAPSRAHEPTTRPLRTRHPGVESMARAAEKALDRELHPPRSANKRRR